MERSSGRWRRCTVVAIAVFLPAAAAQAARLLPSAYRRPIHSILDATSTVAVVVSVSALIAIVVATAILARSTGWADDAAPLEEPMVPSPRAPVVRRRCPVVGLVGLESRAGASSIAFNAAVLAAVEGWPQREGIGATRPRVLCLLSEGERSAALGLRSEEVGEHLARRAGRLGEDLMEATVRHPSGAQLLGMPHGRMGRHQLRLLRRALGRHYDLIVIDGTSGDRTLGEGLEDTADAVVAVALPTVDSAVAAAALLDRCLGGPRMATIVLLVNQLRAWDRCVDELTVGFPHVAALPHDHHVVEADARGQPWSLLGDGLAAAMLRELVAQMLPELFGHGEVVVDA